MFGSSQGFGSFLRSVSNLMVAADIQELPSIGGKRFGVAGLH